MTERCCRQKNGYREEKRNILRWEKVLHTGRERGEIIVDRERRGIDRNRMRERESTRVDNTGRVSESEIYKNSMSIKK